MYSFGVLKEIVGNAHFYPESPIPLNQGIWLINYKGMFIVI